MTREDELFGKVKILTKRNEELYEKYCELLKERAEKKDIVRDSDVQMMKAIVHNKVLLMVILSKLGMEDDEIDTLNQKIYKSLNESIEELLQDDMDDENEN